MKLSSPVLCDRGKVASVSIVYMLLVVAFTCFLIVSNLVEIKTIDLGPLTITAGVILFPFTYIINDCTVEVYGFERARLMIWTGFTVNLIVSLIMQLAIALPGSEDWAHQDAMEAIFGAVPRIFIASLVAFIAGSMVNASVMARMKARDLNRRFKLRAILSTILGEGADSVIFFPIAFLGVLPVDVIIKLIVTQTLLKTAYEILILPVTVRVVSALKKIEGGDVYDSRMTTSYSWIPRIKF